MTTRRTPQQDEAFAHARKLVAGVRRMPGDHIGRDAELVHLDDEVNRLRALLGADHDGGEGGALARAGEAISGGTMRLREVRRVAAHMRTLSFGHEGRDDDLIALDDEVGRLMGALAAPPATMDKGIWEALPVGTNVVVTWEDGRAPYTVIRGAEDNGAVSCGGIGIYGGKHWDKILTWQDERADLNVVFTPSTDYLPEGTRVRLNTDIGDDEIRIGEEGSVMTVHASGYVKVGFDSLPEMIHISNLDLVKPKPGPEFQVGRFVTTTQDHRGIRVASNGVIVELVDGEARVDFGTVTQMVSTDALLVIDTSNPASVRWGQS